MSCRQRLGLSAMYSPLLAKSQLPNIAVGIFILTQNIRESKLEVVLDRLANNTSGSHDYAQANTPYNDAYKKQSNVFEDYRQRNNNRS